MSTSAPVTSPQRFGELARQWLLPAAFGGWSAWKYLPTPTGTNLLLAVTLFALTLALDLLWRPPPDPALAARPGRRLGRRTLVFLGAALLVYALLLLSVLRLFAGLLAL